MLQVEQVSTSEMMRVLEAARSMPAGGSVVSFEQARKAAIQEMDEDRRSEWFANRLYQHLERVPTHRTVANVAVDISRDGLWQMEHNPEYRQKILDLIARDFGSSHASGRTNLLIQIGSDAGSYRTTSWAAGDDRAYMNQTSSAFYRRVGSGSQMGSVSAPSPSAFGVFREHLQMQLEKLDEQPIRTTDVGASQSAERMNAYEENMYEDVEIRAFQG